jgi:hypothetical protein
MVITIMLNDYYDTWKGWDRLINFYDPNGGNVFEECKLQLDLDGQIIESPRFGVDKRNLYIKYFVLGDQNVTVWNEVRGNEKIFVYPQRPGLELSRETIINSIRVSAKFYSINNLLKIKDNDAKSLITIILLISEAARFEVVRRLIRRLIDARIPTCSWELFGDPLLKNWGKFGGRFVSIGKFEDKGTANDIKRTYNNIYKQYAPMGLINPGCDALTKIWDETK